MAQAQGGVPRLRASQAGAGVEWGERVHVCSVEGRRGSKNIPSDRWCAQVVIDLWGFAFWHKHEAVGAWLSRQGGKAKFLYI